MTQETFSVQLHTILVSDDDFYSREALSKLMRGDGYQVIEAENGLQALALCQSEVCPDLILMDTVMPEMDGFEACRRIRELPICAELPIILLAGFDDDETVLRAFDAGATDYIAKPPRPMLLRERVRHQLKSRDIKGRLKLSEERYRIISEMISDYAYAYEVNPDQTLTKRWNTQAFHDITGYSPHELLESDWERLIHPEDIGLALQRYQRLLSGQSDITEFRLINKKGEIRWLRDHGYPVIDENSGRVTQIYGGAQDITRQKEDEARMQHQAEELRQRNEELDAFAYTVAHDLKNPIASMMGFASLIQNYYDRMPEETIKEYLELIMEGGYKLKDIINALLVLAGVSKMEKAEMSELDMQSIVDGTKKRLKTLIQESSANIVLPVEWPPAAGYAPWVEEIWTNYLSNALKYGGKPPSIELGAEPQPDGMVRFWVRDNGNGLTPEEQTRVFTPFTRLNQVKVEGHGLGLSVVQRIVDKLGGQVGLESAIGQGSVFSFTLPPC